MEDQATETPQTTEVQTRSHRDWLGSFVGLAIFLGGIALLYTVFKQALDLFGTPPRVQLNVQPGKPIEIGTAFNAIMGVIVKILLLVLMTWLGSVIANRGVYLYSHSKSGRKT